MLDEKESVQIFAQAFYTRVDDPPPPNKALQPKGGEMVHFPEGKKRAFETPKTSKRNV